MKKYNINVIKETSVEITIDDSHKDYARLIVDYRGVIDNTAELTDILEHIAYNVSTDNDDFMEGVGDLRELKKSGLLSIDCQDSSINFETYKMKYKRSK
jgi:hypothetical protein